MRQVFLGLYWTARNLHRWSWLPGEVGHAVSLHNSTSHGAVELPTALKRRARPLQGQQVPTHAASMPTMPTTVLLTLSPTCCDPPRERFGDV